MTDDALDQAIRDLYADAQLPDAFVEKLTAEAPRRSPLFAVLLALAAAATLIITIWTSTPPKTEAPAPAPAPATAPIEAPADETLTWSVTISKLDAKGVEQLEGSVLTTHPDLLHLLPADFQTPEGAEVVSKPEIVTRWEQAAELIMGSEAPDRLELKLVGHPAGDGQIKVYANVALWGQLDGSGPHKVGPVSRPAKMGLASEIDGNWLLVVIEV